MERYPITADLEKGQPVCFSSEESNNTSRTNKQLRSIEVLAVSDIVSVIALGMHVVSPFIAYFFKQRADRTIHEQCQLVKGTGTANIQ